jgi:hypothetical protein
MFFPLQAIQGMLGWHRGPWGYHDVNGKVFTEYGIGVPYGPMYKSGDVIGCGWNRSTRGIFFTKNGQFLGKPVCDFTGYSTYICRTGQAATGIPKRLLSVVGMGENEIAPMIS